MFGSGRIAHRLVGPTLVAVVLSLALAACGSEGDGGSEAASGDGQGLARLTPSDRVYTVDDLTTAGLKTLHHYDIEELPDALDAWHLSYKPGGTYFEYEARFYASHGDAVEHGTSWAETATGADAIVVGPDVWLEEGSTHRRKCSRAAETPHSGCAYSARYGDFIILGNMILMCEGPDSKEALQACQPVFDNLQ